jgi:hypothetical protein
VTPASPPLRSPPPRCSTPVLPISLTPERKDVGASRARAELMRDQHHHPGRRTSTARSEPRLGPVLRIGFVVHSPMPRATSPASPHELRAEPAPPRADRQRHRRCDRHRPAAARRCRVPSRSPPPAPPASRSRAGNASGSSSTSALASAAVMPALGVEVATAAAAIRRRPTAAPHARYVIRADSPRSQQRRTTRRLHW